MPRDSNNRTHKLFMCNALMQDQLQASFTTLCGVFRIQKVIKYKTTFAKNLTLPKRSLAFQRRVDYMWDTLLSFGLDKQNVVQHVAWHSNAEFGRDMPNFLQTMFRLKGLHARTLLVHSKLGIGMPSYVLGSLLSLGRDKQNVVQHVAWHSNAEFGRDMSNLLLTTYPNSVCTAFTLAGIPSYVLVTIII